MIRLALLVVALAACGNKHDCGKYADKLADALAADSSRVAPVRTGARDACERGRISDKELACVERAGRPEDVRECVGAPEIKSHPTEPPLAQQQPPPATATPVKYPAEFPYLPGGTVDPGFDPPPEPGEISHVLVTYPGAQPDALAQKLGDSALLKGWKCDRDNTNLACTKGTGSVHVLAKPHPQGGTALFVFVP